MNSDQALSDGDFPEESVPKDKRQVVRGCASPPGGPSREAVQDNRQYDAPLPIVDLVIGRCKPGKLSPVPHVRLNSCVYDHCVCATARGVSSDTVVPPAIVANEVIDVDASVPVAGTPAPVVEQPSSPVKEGIHVVELPQPLPLSGWSSSSSSPTLPWGTAEDSSPPFSPNRVQAGRSQDVPDEGSLFNVSPLSPGLLFQPTRGGQSPPAEGILLPTTLDDFDDSVLGDPITYARCEHFPGSESPLSLPVYAWPYDSACLLDPTVLQTVLTSGTSSVPATGTSTAAPSLDLGAGRLLESGLPGCPYRFSGSGGLPFSNGNPAYGLQLHHLWSLSEHQSRPAYSTVRRRSGSISWAKIKHWQRPSPSSGMRASCCQIFRYCLSSLRRYTECREQRSTTYRRRHGQLGRHRICRPWACGALRRVRVIPGQCQLRHAARV